MNPAVRISRDVFTGYRHFAAMECAIDWLVKWRGFRRSDLERMAEKFADYEPGALLQFGFFSRETGEFLDYNGWRSGEQGLIHRAHRH